MGRTALLDRPALDMLRHADGLTIPGVERLQGIDRALRALEDSEGFGREASAGWALSGSAALLGVWIRSDQTLRIPRALALAPILHREIWPIERLTTLIALGLPGGVVGAVKGGALNGLSRGAGVEDPGSGLGMAQGGLGGYGMDGNIAGVNEHGGDSPAGGLGSAVGGLLGTVSPPAVAAVPTYARPAFVSKFGRPRGLLSTGAQLTGFRGY